MAVAPPEVESNFGWDQAFVHLMTRLGTLLARDTPASTPIGQVCSVH